jgi:hypothetical protein
VDIRWKDRKTACEAAVLPGESEVFMGAYPLEGLNLMIRPKTQEAIGAHGNKKYDAVK